MEIQLLRNVRTTNPSGNVVINDISDGVVSITGFNNFTFTSMPSNSNRSVSIIGDDGFQNQSYSTTVSTPILHGTTFTLRNGSKSITFVNNGEVISSAYALSSYLQNKYPIRFMISKLPETVSSVSAVTDKSDFLPEPTPSKINAIFDGVQSMSGLSSFQVTKMAVSSSSTVTITGNDGNSESSFSIDTIGTVPIAADESFTLTNISNGSSMTLVNNCGCVIKTANGLAAYLQMVYPVGTMLSNDIYSKTATLKTLIGTPTDSTTDSIITRLGIPLQNGNPSSIANIIGGVQSSGVTLSTLLGDPGKTSIISTIGGSTSVSDGLKTLRTGLCGMSDQDTSLFAQIDSIGASLLKSPTGIISEDLKMLRSFIVVDQGNTAQEDVEIVTSLVNASTATNNNNVFSGVAFSKFTNATNLEGQLRTLLDLFNNASLANSVITQLTIDLSAGAPKSLAELVSRIK